MKKQDSVHLVHVETLKISIPLCLERVLIFLIYYNLLVQVHLNKKKLWDIPKKKSHKDGL